MRSITPAIEEVAQHIVAALGVEQLPTRRYFDANEESDIFLMTAKDCPQTGVNTFATVGLCEHPLMRNGVEAPIRVEIVGACGSAYAGLDDIVSTVAFGVINSKWFCAPGVIFPGAVSMHPGVSETMSDIFFSNPYLWDGKLNSTAQIAGHTVAWLLSVPVSKRETEYARVNGPAELAKLLERSNVDMFNLNRPSVL